LPDDISVAKDTSVMETTDEIESPVVKEVEPPSPEQTTEDIIVSDKLKAIKPVKSVWSKVYIVCQNDTLADIAKKLYGPEEGNRRINVDRIFEANRNLLKSPHEIFVGQKLTIPPLVASETETKETQSSLVNSIFETVKSIGRKNLSTNPDKEMQSVPYIVRQDDNLWRIAAEQLGNGSRYKEISELNANIIKNENDLEVGMLLRIPVR
jgi:nucleoid-associated protein YgaU